jgi:hypothetical protein
LNDYIFTYLRYFYKIKEDIFGFQHGKYEENGGPLVDDGGKGGGSPSEVLSYFTKLRLSVRMQHMGLPLDRIL